MFHILLVSIVMLIFLNAYVFIVSTDMLISSLCCSLSPLSVRSVYRFRACRFSVLFPFLAVSACTTACCHSTLFQLQLLFTCQQAPSLTSTCAVCHIIQSSVPPPGFRPVALPCFAVVTLQGSCGNLWPPRKPFSPRSNSFPICLCMCSLYGAR